jgi:hypothetical protein
MIIEFEGQLWKWQGPSPWYFVTVPEQQSRELDALRDLVTPGWGMIPAEVRIGKTAWKTSLFPKDGRYDLPIKASIRKAEHLEQGDTLSVRLEVRL